VKKLKKSIERKGRGREEREGRGRQRGTDKRPREIRHEASLYFMLTLHNDKGKSELFKRDEMVSS
jgi:hypothetical protein